MSLSQLALAVTLILLGLSLPGWVAISPVIIGICALVAGILLLLEGLSVWTWSTPKRG